MGYPVFIVTLNDGNSVAYLDYCPHKGRPVTSSHAEARELPALLSPSMGSSAIWELVS
jgi:nitrite reductase/ring-hydroxylating ferredoxin subunit